MNKQVKKSSCSALLATAFVFLMAVSASAVVVNWNVGKGHALLPLSFGQVGRINIANLGDPKLNNSCEVKVSFLAGDGSVIGNPQTNNIQPSQLVFVDFSDRTIPLGGRRTVRVLIELTDPPEPEFPVGPCLVQEEVFDRMTGRTQFVGDPNILPQLQEPPEPE